MEKEIKIKKKYNAVWVTAMVLGTLLLVLLSFAFLPKIYDSCILKGEPVLDDGWEGTAMLGLYVGYVIGYIFVWWRLLVGSIILLINAIVHMALFLIISGNTGSLIFGLPILVVGILYLVAYLQRRVKGER